MIFIAGPLKNISSSLLQLINFCTWVWDRPEYTLRVIGPAYRATQRKLSENIRRSVRFDNPFFCKYLHFHTCEIVYWINKHFICISLSLKQKISDVTDRYCILYSQPTTPVRSGGRILRAVIKPDYQHSHIHRQFISWILAFWWLMNYQIIFERPSAGLCAATDGETRAHRVRAITAIINLAISLWTFVRYYHRESPFCPFIIGKRWVLLRRAVARPAAAARPLLIL